MIARLVQVDDDRAIGNKPMIEFEFDFCRAIFKEIQICLSKQHFEIVAVAMTVAVTTQWMPEIPPGNSTSF